MGETITLQAKINGGKGDENCVYLEESRKGLLVCQPVSRAELFSPERSEAKTKSRMNCRPLIVASFTIILLSAS